LNDKFHELAAPVVGEAAARALLKRLWVLETAKNLEFDHGERTAARAVS